MANSYLGFNERFVDEIKNKNKLETLRLPNKFTETVVVGDIVDAIVSHNRGAFAKLKIVEIETMTVKQILNTDFDTHKNYESLDDFNSRMSEYYETPFSLDDVFVFIRYEVVEVL